MNDTPESEKQKLLEILRNFRKENGLRQSDLAIKLGKPQSYVSKYESGERTLDFFEVKLICEALGKSLEQLIKRLKRTA